MPCGMMLIPSENEETAKQRISLPSGALSPVY
jgi:hypothetical protein